MMKRNSCKLLAATLMGFLALSVPAALMVYEPFEGTEGSTFVGSAGGIGWSNSWNYDSGADINIGNYGKFSSIYSDGTNALAAAGSAALIQGNTGPLERLVASSATNLFGDGESVWISYRSGFLRGDYKTTGVTFGFNGGSLVVEFDGQPNANNLIKNDNIGTVKVGGVDSKLISPIVNIDFFFVLKIAFSSSGAETVTLWRDPVLNVEPSAETVLVSASLELGSSLMKVKLNSDGTNSDGKFDEFRVGESFSDITPSVMAPPVIAQFAVNHNVVTNVGDSITLSWDTIGADYVSISPEIGEVGASGSQIVQLYSNAVYTIIATNSSGSATAGDIYAYVKDQMPPNILFIAIDDLKRIGGYFSEDPGNFIPRVYPDPAIRAQVVANLTPNIDQLASGGVAFMRAYCASPACNASRAALMTGYRSHKTGLVDNGGAVFFRDWTFGGTQPMANATTLPKHLENNGYYTAGTGKIYHGYDFSGNDGHNTWTDFVVIDGSVGTAVLSPYSPNSFIEWGQEGPDTANFTQMQDYLRADFMATLIETGTSGSISLPAEKPFFIACGIQKPHLPYYATKDLADLFPVSQMTGVTRALYNEFLDDCDDLPATGLIESGATLSNGDPILDQVDQDKFIKILNKGLEIDPVDGDLDGWKSMLQYYFACAALADRSVGRLLEGLENSPYANNTIVILWSDHGYHLGEKMHLTKFALWEDSAGVHFIVRDPKYVQSAGIKCQRPVNLVDIYPTLCARLGFPTSDPNITGHDLSPLLADPMSPWNIPSLCSDESVSNNMIAMDRFKLIRYQGNASDAELYDHDADPDEYHNLIGDPAYTNEQAEMLNLLDIALAEGTFPAEQEWSLENWRHAYWNHSSNTNDAADDADPDGDGRNNFEEFALLGNPLVASPELTNAITFTIEGGEAAYRFPFRDAPGNVGYAVDQATNLSAGFSNLWNSAADSVDDVTETDHGNGTRNLRVGMPTDRPASFMQLKIVKP